MIKKYTVTIALSAYNEENNIKSLLESVLAQKETNFTIKSIWIFSDGSRDNTAKKVKQINDNRIKLFNYKSRMGNLLV